MALLLEGCDARSNIAHNASRNTTSALPQPRSPCPARPTPASTRSPLHAGAAPDPATGARAVPIHLTTSFVFENSEHAASLFNMERSGHVYSRI